MLVDAGTGLVAAVFGLLALLQSALGIDRDICEIEDAPLAVLLALGEHLDINVVVDIRPDLFW